MIGIIGAMDMEVNGLKERMQNTEVETIGTIDFYKGTIQGIPCVVARSGVGKVNAAICAQIMALVYRPKAIINTGVAGGIGKGVSVGDVVVSRGLVQHDMDTSAVGDPKGFISGMNLITIPATEKLVNLVVEKAKHTYQGAVHIGIIATGDQFIGQSDKLKEISNQFQAIACEMEGGSIAQVCYMNGHCFVVIRAISDNADEAANISFEQFAAMAAEKSIQLLCEVLPALV